MGLECFTHVAFDSTGLALQDLAIAKAALAKAGQLGLSQLEP